MDDVIYIDLFSGIGGFAYGFEEAGMNISHHYFSEIDKHAIAVYKYHFKNAIYVGDIKSVSGVELRKRHPGAKFIISFGFPCQDLSISGKGEGFDGKRSVLFFEAIRIIKEIGDQCEVFVFENVKGLLTHNKGKTFEVVLGTIADIGLYECEWQLVNTRWVLPQNRERIYFVGHLRGRSKPRVFPFRESDSLFASRNGERKGQIPFCTAITQNYHKGVHNQGETYVISNFGINRKFEERTVLTPLRNNTGAGNNDFVIQKTGGYCVTIKNGETGTLQSGGSNVMDKVPNIITSHHPHCGDPDVGGTGPIESSDYSLTIDCISHIVNNIRRLTEIEYERLQGFPDDWTKYGDYDGKIKKISRTQRYKQLGNAVTTHFPKLIAQRIIG